MQVKFAIRSFMRNEKSVLCVAMSGDERRIVSGSADSKVWVWIRSESERQMELLLCLFNGRIVEVAICILGRRKLVRDERKGVLSIWKRRCFSCFF